MNTDNDYKWLQRDKEWFMSKIGQRVEYASLTIIKQQEKAGLIPMDNINSEKDAEYHAKLSAEYQWYYRVTHIQTGFIKGLLKEDKKE